MVEVSVVSPDFAEYVTGTDVPEGTPAAGGL
jgi:hypothetical protein